MVSSKKIFQLSLLNENFNLLLQVITLVCIMFVISMETTVLAFVLLARISFHLLRPF